MPPSPPDDDSFLESPLSPPAQWPLPATSSPKLPPRSPKRLLRPPKQEIRPVSDNYPIQQPSPGSSPDYLEPPSFRFNRDEDPFSPSARPFSGASEASSLGSIPDFPVPEPPMPIVQAPLRRTPSLGPPPSSRRGPSSYYTQMSYVSPIVEEAETRSNTIRSRHGSYASSNVFPSNSDDFYPDDDYPLSDDDETMTSGRALSAISSQDDDSNLVRDSPVLVRQASLGRRTKPSLMTIRSTDNFGDRRNGDGNSGVAGAMGAGMGLGALGAAGSKLYSRDGSGSPGQSSPDLLSPILGGSNPFASSESIERFQNAQPATSPFANPESPIFPLRSATRSSFAERVGFRRPPRLDVDAVRDAEARGSLTSLPDLIRRATRLAANLDRGKTASRLGMDFWENGAPDRRDTRQSNAASLTDMLAAFPPPGQETPPRSRAATPADSGRLDWPIVSMAAPAARSPLGKVQAASEKSKKRRRCCGLPLWTFITLLIVLLFIVAAAVVIPIVLVVIPNQNKNSTTAAQDNTPNQGNNNPNNPALPGPTSGAGNANGQCNTCQNGGVAIMAADKSCDCVCINGFTGSTCSNNDATGCTTTSVSNTADNATMGAGIPRLIESASRDFNIPLDTIRILSLFSSLSLSCAAENALITFNGLASRSIPPTDLPINIKTTLQVSRSLPDLHHPHPVQSQGYDENQHHPSLARDTPAEFISTNTTAVDFARVGVLFALQESGTLDTAANAQEKVQDFLTSNRNGVAMGNTVDLGIFEMNLVNFTIEFRNGTIIQPA
jgi:hypothetical protein